MKARWNDIVVAESDDTVVVEGNHYFPLESIKAEHFKPSESTTHCPWKGDASYYTLVVNGEENPDAAWYYADPSEKAESLRGRVAFWKGVVVEE